MLGSPIGGTKSVHRAPSSSADQIDCHVGISEKLYHHNVPLPRYDEQRAEVLLYRCNSANTTYSPSGTLLAMTFTVVSNWNHGE